MTRLARVLLAVLLGPLAYWRRSMLLSALLIVAVVLLTILTQIGGLVLWLAVPLVDVGYERWRKFGRVVPEVALTSCFLLFYSTLSLGVLPSLMKLSDRPALQCFGSDSTPYRAASWLYCLLNRNYAARPIHRLLEEASRDLASRYPGSVLLYLDAGFPFFDEFPTLPHLSHDNGRIVDLAFSTRWR